MKRLIAIALSLAVSGTALGQSTEGLGIPSRRSETQIEAGKLSKLPKLKKFVEADYPKEAADKGVEAEVVLLLDINAKGEVDSASIAQPATPPGLGFDEAAMVAAQQFEFEPAEMNGKPIAVQLSYRYKFKLKARPTPEVPPAGTPAPQGAASQPALPARAPVVNFSGVLRERGTRLVMPGALVTIFREIDDKPVGFEATTDAQGKFRFFDLAPGEWKVLSEPPGYYPFRTTETIRAGEAIDVTYYVERGSYNPFDVTVTAERPRKEVSRTVLSAKEIDKVPGTAGDPLGVIQNFPGVARSPVAGQLIVRGSAPEDTRVFVDGSDVPLLYHFGGLRSVIPVGILDSIEFYPGNFSPMYGRATGGVIDVQVKKLQPEKVGGYADVSILDTGVYLEAPLGKKGGVAVSARRSYIDWILDAAVPSDATVNLVTAPRYYDYQLLANYRPTPAHDLRLLVFGSDDALKVLFQNPADLDPAFTSNSITSNTSFYRAALTYKYTPSPNFQNDLRVSGGTNWFNTRAGNLILDLTINTAQIRDTVHQKVTDWLTLNYGIDTVLTEFDALVQLPRPTKEGQPMGNFDPTAIVRSDTKGQKYAYPAGFAELELRPVPHLLLLPGLRVDYLGRVQQTYAQPRFTGRWELGHGFTTKGGVGLFVEEPDIMQGETDPVFGNPWLTAERAWHYSLGLEWKPKPFLAFDITGFYKQLSNLVSATDAIVEVNGVERPLINDNGGRGHVYGLELVARHEFANNFTGWVAYTLSRSIRRDSGATEDRLFDYDQTHILTLVGSYLLPRNWQIGGRFRLVSGNPLTPVSGAVWNASADRYDPTYGKVNSDRVAPFHQLDIRVDKRWIYQSWMLNLYLDIQNVYNRANPEGLQYSFNYRQSRPQQGLPILPILGIRAEF